ncbi:hypothetical protein [Nocardia rhamnosiphila]|uniref:Uncharacterized protein n=1 Tax=Nocardia rhamnosiphila TaxID=426716 RepID=A0ABV2WIX8_9NOCA
MAVSVPEKTLEHWASQYINYRFRSNAALWWPTSGVDIDAQGLPLRPGKAVSFELKTTLPGSTRVPRPPTSGSKVYTHSVDINLTQLRNYLDRPLGLQPFYAFPMPIWQGQLNEHAKRNGYHPSDTAFRRSRDLWFASWMSVMTTAEVASALASELSGHDIRNKKVSKTLVCIDYRVKDRSHSLRWASGRSNHKYYPWRDFWGKLADCGSPDWPQRIIVPSRMISQLGPEITHRDVRDLFKEMAYSEPGEPLSILTPDPQGVFTDEFVGATSTAMPSTLSDSQSDDLEPDIESYGFHAFLNASIPSRKSGVRPRPSR